MHAVGGALHASRVSQYDLCIFVSVRHAVYHDAVEHTRLQVLLLYVKVISRNLVVEDAFGNLQFRRLLLHAIYQCTQFHGGLGGHLVLEIIAAHAQDCHKEKDGTDDAEQ